MASERRIRGSIAAACQTHGPHAWPSDHATRGQTPVPPLPASWRSPATSASRSDTPRDRSAATTSSPWRRSATCIVSNSASSAGVSHAGSARRSASVTRARRWPPNWRTLAPHQEAEDRVKDGPQDLAADRVVRRKEEQDEQDEDPVLLEDRPELPRRARIDERQHDLGAVERRDRDEVEQHQDDVELDEDDEDPGQQRDLLGKLEVRGEVAERDRGSDGEDQVGERSSGRDKRLTVPAVPQVERIDRRRLRPAEPERAAAREHRHGKQRPADRVEVSDRVD